MVRLFNTHVPARTLLFTLSESVLVILGFVLAVVLWAGTTFNANVYLIYENGIGRIAIIMAVFLLLMYYFDLYNSFIVTNRREVATRLLGVLGCTFVALAVLYYIFPWASLGGSVLWVGCAITAIIVPLWRGCFFIFNHSPRFAERVVMYGEGPLAATLIQEIERHRELGIRIAGFVGQSCPVDGIPCLDPDTLSEFVAQQGVRRIIVTMFDLRDKIPVDLFLNLKNRGVEIQNGSEFYEMVTGKIALASLRLSWLLFSPGFQLSRGLRLYKRMLSVVLSGIAIVLSLPVMVLIAIAIRLDSPGAIIFQQRRVGEDGRLFTVYKFRSMYDGADKLDLRPAEHEDSRVTRVGKWLRRMRLDELPQLFNVMKGDMAFVGPRPFVPEQEEECAANIPFYRERWLAKPGVTGWAQINRGYNATLDDNREKLAYDLFYIKNVSVGLDLYIIFATCKILLLGRGGR
jgi:sugar transferase (PEP-CTERM system associated)